MSGQRRAAAIDIGSNTIKFTAAAIDDTGTVNVLAEDAVITRLSAGLSAGGRLDPSAVERTIDGLRPMLDRIAGLDIDDIRAVATAGLRRAVDPEVFLDRARRELGLAVDVIDGQTEAALSFRGAMTGPFGRSGIVVDIGGRSTEIAVGRRGRLEASTSIDLGTITLTELALAAETPSPDEVEAARQRVRRALGPAPPDPGAGPLIGVSGTVLALAGKIRGIPSMSELLRAAESKGLSRARIEAALVDLACRPAAERIYGEVLPAGRADVIVAGAVLLLEVMAHYGKDPLAVTPRGLRHGLLVPPVA